MVIHAPWPAALCFDIRLIAATLQKRRGGCQTQKRLLVIGWLHKYEWLNKHVPGSMRSIKLAAPVKAWEHAALDKE